MYSFALSNSHMYTLYVAHVNVERRGPAGRHAAPRLDEFYEWTVLVHVLTT